MSNQPSEAKVIIIKNIKKKVHKHHGGAWKIAYADFVTAMMTFFLLMWLLSMLNKYQQQGIANYFKKPLKELFNNQHVDSAKNSNAKEKTGPLTYNKTGFQAPSKNPGVDVDQTTRKVNANDNTAASADKLKLQKNEEVPLYDQNKKSLNNSGDMEKLKADMEAKLKNDPVMSQFQNQLNFVVTSDGLKVIIKDLEEKPMFSQGKTDFEQYAVEILSWLTEQINGYNNKIVVIGHTDSVPYSGENGYSNWELSSDRANATRRVLIGAGLPSDKVLRVIGGADTNLLNKEDPYDPSNRRIEIIVLTDKAVENMQK